MTSVEEARLMAVDMGAEWVKTATLDITTHADGAPSAAVGIVLNDQSNRKSPPCVSFRCQPARRGQESLTFADGIVCERGFAEEALALAPRFPAHVVCAPALLMGLAPEDAMVRAALTVPSTGADLAAGLAAEGRAVTLAEEEVSARFLFRVAANHSREAFTVRIPGDRQQQRAAADGTAGGAALHYSPEELLAMLLGRSTDAVRKLDMERNGLRAGSDPAGELAVNVVRHAALTVPSFASVAERQAYLDAGELSGLRVVRLVHSVTAAATALVYYREEQLFANPSDARAPLYLMVYDMGSRQTEAAVFELAAPTAVAEPDLDPNTQVRLNEGNTRRRRVGRLTMLSMATNRTLGGGAFDQCIASHWDRKFLHGRVFAPLPATATAVERRDASKRRAAMLRAANKARERLSANREAPVTVEGVATSPSDDTPFTTTLSRTDFEAICADLFVSAVQVRDDALAATNGAVSSLRQLKRFEVVGGAMRTPRLLEMVSAGYAGGLADRTLNGDEAVAVGTAYLGAASARMLPRKYDVHEPLTNDIAAFLLQPRAPAGHGFTVVALTDDAAAPLFPAHRTSLPALKTIVLGGVEADFDVTLAAPPRLAAVALELASAGASAGAPRVCPGCFWQHNRVQDVAAALARAERVAALHTGRRHGAAATSVRVTLNSTEVVLEVAVTESGVPLLRKAFVRARYSKEELPLPPADVNRTDSAALLGSDMSDEDGNHTGAPASNDADAADVPIAETTEAPPPAGKSVTRFVRVFGLHATVLYGEEEEKGTSDSSARLSLPRGVNLFPREIDHSRGTLRRLQQVDDYRYACSFLRNAMESRLISLRMLNEFTDEKDLDAAKAAAAAAATAVDGASPVTHVSGHYSSNDTSHVEVADAAQADARAKVVEEATEDLLRWRALVKELSEWLEDVGDTATQEELAQKNTRTERLERGVAHAFK